MKNLLNKQKNKGFTMIELIIVISILGILAAYALPRFGSFTGTARTAARDNVVGTLNAALGVVNAQWTSNGGVGTVTLQGSPTAITVTASGYPNIGAALTYNSAAQCTVLLSGLLSQTNGLTASFASPNCTVTNANWTSPITLSQTNAF